MPSVYQFAKRSRPAEDIFNAALNYLYGMLYHLVQHAILQKGLDPFLPIFHRDEYAARGFVFDYIEGFRPWADRVLIELGLKEKLLSSHFRPTNMETHLYCS